MAPGGLVAGRHDVGMAGKGDVRGAVADARIEIVDIGGAGFAERDAVRLKTFCLEDVLENAQRAGVSRGDGGAAQQIAGNRKGVGGR